MTPELWIAILTFATKFGIEAAIAIVQGMKSANIDDAIAALQMAQSKTAQSYLDEAAAQLPKPPTV